ncbi:tRNA (adenosine(37)-N6)-dimethylallyltransferase MiaA [Candidatus Uhrbacteria bacterium]|nr:tRNA (adenosine(37)-N6)-dimethylallyltransferase MiaA [Candidatus Uhrbacteria bacterium]
MRKKFPLESRSGNKLIVIIGPTSSGKTSLALKLAQLFNGEIVSADSRQLYRGLTIGTGKATRAELRRVPHHLIDWKNPGKTVSLAQYKKAADSALAHIIKSGRNAFLVGGTPLYVRAVLDNYQMPAVAPDKRFRARHEKFSVSLLHKMLHAVDPNAAKDIGPYNARRLIRALEVWHVSKRKFSDLKKQSEHRYTSLVLGLDCPRVELYRRIDRRVDQRMKRGMISEVKTLLKNGVSARWLQSLGLEYRAIISYLAEGESPKQKEKLVQSLKYAIHDFARRQLVWYRKFPDVHWVAPDDITHTRIMIKHFLNDTW